MRAVASEQTQTYLLLKGILSASHTPKALDL
jgi:hypothetical protein